MKYTVTVTSTQESVGHSTPNSTNPVTLISPVEIFRQGFDDPDTVRKIALVINTPTRGRPAKKAKEVAS